MSFSLKVGFVPSYRFARHPGRRKCATRAWRPLQSRRASKSSPPNSGPDGSLPDPVEGLRAAGRRAQPRRGRGRGRVFRPPEGGRVDPLPARFRRRALGRQDRRRSWACRCCSTRPRSRRRWKTRHGPRVRLLLRQPVDGLGALPPQDPFRYAGFSFPESRPSWSRRETLCARSPWSRGCKARASARWASGQRLRRPSATTRSP